LVGLLSAAAGPAAAASLSTRELLDILRHASPAPNPSAPPNFGTQAVGPRPDTPVAYDPQLRSEVDTHALSSAARGAAAGGSAAVPPYAGRMPRAASVGGPEESAAEGNTLPDARLSSGEAGAAGAGPSVPMPVYYTLDMPWRSIVKLLMRFNVDGIDRYYVCSAAEISSFHLLTAGHCLYNWDPNKDGNTDDARWADEVWAWSAQTDLLEPIGTPEWPFGEAESVLLRSYTGWTSSQDRAWDWGVVVLNRRDGDHTGWMGREYGFTPTALNFSGYPTEDPYVPADSLVQYFGFDDGNVIDFTDSRIQMSALTYGGHSGGPAWRYDSSSGGRWIEGVLSTSDRMGYAESTLLTSGKFDDLDAWIAEDESMRPPTALPDLSEDFFNADAKFLYDTSVPAGASISFDYNVLNVGFADSGDIGVDFYLFADPLTPVAYLGSETLANLAAYTYAHNFATVTVPGDTWPGLYYVGWEMSAAAFEYSYSNNSAVIGEQLLLVEPPPCPGDCAASGAVDINDLVTLVNVSLGSMPISQCVTADLDHNSVIEINELVSAVLLAERGC